jgi:adenylate kinase family enzyme
VFHAETEPLKEFYEKLGVLKLVEGNQSIENISREILAALGM